MNKSEICRHFNKSTSWLNQNKKLCLEIESRYGELSISSIYKYGDLQRELIETLHVARYRMSLREISSVLYPNAPYPMTSLNELFNRLCYKIREDGQFFSIKILYKLLKLKSYIREE